MARTMVLIDLTDREREIGMLAATGLSNREIAERLSLSLRTVEGHVYRAMAKLHITDRSRFAEHFVQPTLSEVMGRNTKDVRCAAGVTLKGFAQVLRRYGIKWSTGAVSDFESGRTAPDLRTLIAVVVALNEILGDADDEHHLLESGPGVTLSDLFHGTGRVQINKEFSMPLDLVWGLLEGLPLQSVGKMWARESEAH